MDLQISTAFISSGCSCRPNILKWCHSTSYIIFAARNDICLAGFDEEKGIYRILDNINASQEEVISIELSSDETSLQSLLCSASANGELAVWRLMNGPKPIENIYRVKKDSNTKIAKAMLLRSTENASYLFSSAQLDQIEMEFMDESFVALHHQVLKFSHGIVLTFDFVQINQNIIMAVGLSSGVVEIYWMDRLNSRFSMSLSLSTLHNSWCRSLAFKEDADGIWLATATDNLVKIWKFLAKDEDVIEENANLNLLTITPNRFSVEGKIVTVTLETVLSDHTGLVHSLSWHPNKREILSSAADKSVIRWQYSDEESPWLACSRLGEVGGEEISYYDATYSSDGRLILYHSFVGALHLWHISDEAVVPKSLPISGHCDEVTDIDWEPSGTYLISCSKDMTTRIFSQSDSDIFFEIARPQIHGHALNCLSSVSSTVFVSGGEEKIFRVFSATSSFVESMKRLSKNNLGQLLLEDNLPSSAYQTELTLTNKIADNEEAASIGTAKGVFNEFPREDELRFTLFPEIHKLYGHGFEVFSIASNHAATVLATACKASHPDHAIILLWDTKNWQQVRSLRAHQLTVTRMRFSKDDKYFLSVSRDRTWTLFRLEDGSADSSPFNYSVCHRAEKAASKHSRIIWDCAWSHDSRFFATASRDKLLNIWRTGSDGEVPRHSAKFASGEPQTAVDFAPKHLAEECSAYLIALGLENGFILLLNFVASTGELSEIARLPQEVTHSRTLTRLKFRPSAAISAEKEFQLASSSTDHFVKIHRIELC